MSLLYVLMALCVGGPTLAEEGGEQIVTVHGDLENVLEIKAPFDVYLVPGRYTVTLSSNIHSGGVPIRELFLCGDVPGYRIWKVEEGIPTNIRVSGKSGYSGGIKIFVPKSGSSVWGTATVTFVGKEKTEMVEIDGDFSTVKAETGKEVTLNAGIYRIVADARMLLLVPGNRDPYGWVEVLEGNVPDTIVLDDGVENQIEVFMVKVKEAKIRKQFSVRFIQRKEMGELLKRF